ncbi:FG-GAP repeat domain-containing protein [Roseitranquillus sediminis]|uniref:FG-GAP repeat domain-containing protein n=1 Tax=Roseitranquillus sediminis TaxID=2809051 RepID=UPI0029CA43D6|nr:VCBS repeat-containing protein [Roseitranquillus sediminis]
MATGFESTSDMGTRGNVAPWPRGLALALVLVAPGGRAEVRFEDRSVDLPVSHVYSGEWEHFVGGGVAVFDCDGDALPDIFAAGGTSPARLFRNRGDFRFELGALPEMTAVTGAWPLDIDGDGHMDLAVLRVGENMLLRNQGDCAFGRGDWGFAAGDAWSTSFAATWEAGAGLPTLVVGNYVDRADPEGPFGACDASELHRPRNDGYGKPERFETHCALSMLISDWARSGRRDLRVSNDRHYYIRGGREQMIRLDTMEELGGGDGWPEVSLWGMGIASRDLTGDRLPEVMSTSMGDQLLQIATADGYVAAPYEIGTYAARPFLGDDGRPSTGWHAEFGDVDNDGRDDLFIAKGNVDQMPSNALKDPNNLLMQQSDGRFAETAEAAGVATVERARGAALADFDLDGRLDLVVVNRRAPMELWRNVSDGTGHWLALNLEQPGPNRNAVGAWIELEADGRTRWREITVGGGHGGGQALPQHFGLGSEMGRGCGCIGRMAESRTGRTSEWIPG